MREESIVFNDTNIKVYSMNTVVIGTGASGFNAADRLYNFGQKDIAMVTEGINKGTSRNTGSDKQTYYKLTLAGDSPDSVSDMAQTLFNGGSMDGDIAMVEATLSTQSFYHLVDIGVPFPHNSYGEYVGYKTDHDPRQRATSVGPLTSKYMTEKLEEQVNQKGIKIFDGYQVIGLLVDKLKNKALGVIALNLNSLNNVEDRYVIFNATNIVYAAGGPAAIYATSVYPESHKGSSGIALEAGVMGKNLTESQYGIASTKFRWNLSGTFQQVLPRYISTSKDGTDEKEFLEEYFDDKSKMLDAIFLKGYQWPFDPRKIENFGSSLIDILVYNETVLKKRRVFLDYKKNPSALIKENGAVDFSILNEEGHNYLNNSNALFGTPIERLSHMNNPAIELYKSHNIDLNKEYLEIAVCAQHNNGGLQGNIWWESNIKHFFPVGEVNGSHGIYRPGGSALNSGQVGSTRAAQYIARRYLEEPISTEDIIEICKEQVEVKLNLGNKFIKSLGSTSNVFEIKKSFSEEMSEYGAEIRSLSGSKELASKVLNALNTICETTKLSKIEELPLAYSNYDLLLTQYVYLSSIVDYIEKGGKSRGSYLIHDSNGMLPLENLPEDFRFTIEDGALSKFIQRVTYMDGSCDFSWDQVKAIPKENNWFEYVWNDYRNDKIIVDPLS